MIATEDLRELSTFIQKTLGGLTPTSRISIEHMPSYPCEEGCQRTLITPELLRLLAAGLSKNNTVRRRPETYVSAPVVAQILGIKTATLAKWRREGRGPKGAIRTSDTSVSYPASEVEAFMNEWSKGGCTRCQ